MSDTFDFESRFSKDLPATQQIALALRIVSGLTVKQIARAFLVSEAAMEQRITRAKARVADANVPFETPGAVERSERLASVAAMIYLIFNEGYSASGDTAEIRSPLCEEAIRLARLLLRLFQSEPEIMGLTALLLLQHARAAARFDADGQVILLDDQDRSLWNQKLIAEGLALIDKAMRHRQSGPYQVQAAIAALHARAEKPEDTDWTQIDLLYGALELMQPSPVITLNRAVAVSKVQGPEAALEMIEPLAPRLANYFHYFGVRGAFLMQLGRNEEAQQYYAAALKIVPEEPTVLSNLGLSYMLQNNLPKAEQVLGRAYQRNQSDARIRANLALVLGLQGRETEAEILVKADLPPDQAAAKVAALREVLAKKQQRADK